MRWQKQQEEMGAHILDINMGMNGIDEKEMMLKAIEEVTTDHQSVRSVSIPVM